MPGNRLRGLAAVLGLLAGLAAPARAQESGDAFLRGVDVSHLDRVETHGGVFREAGVAGDALAMLRAHGVNAVRLRLWHTPAGGYNSLARTLAMARRVEAEGMAFLLDLHYSDTWADPDTQTKPAAWNGLSYDVLRDSVRAYTQAVVAAFKAQGTLPDLVQIGNEITSGMLWPEGRVEGSNNWTRLAGLLQAGVDGLRAALEPGDSVSVMIHIDRGGNASTSRWFFDNLTQHFTDFDVIGLSYYYWWGNNTLGQLALNMNAVAARYGRDVVVAETAYPWTLGWGDNTHNPVGEAQHLHPGYPATVDGQKQFLADLLARVRDVPEGRGRGVFYWEPTSIPVAGFGSDWENLTFFDFQNQNNLLASVDAFQPAPSSAAEALPGAGRGVGAVHAYPNPFAGAAEVGFELAAPGVVDVRVYDLLGREVAVLLDGVLRPAGPQRVRFEGRGLAPGVYVYRVRTAQGAAAAGTVVLQK